MSEKDDLGKNPFFDKGPNLIIGMVGLIVIYALISSSFEIIGAGERGVVFSKFGGVKDKILNEGLHFKIPFIEDIIQVDVKVQKSETNATAASKDLQTISSTIALNYHIDPAQVNTVYQDIGVFFKDRLIDPAVQESVKAVAAEFTAEELITRRSEVSKRIEKNMKTRLLEFNIITDGFNIIDFSFSREFNAAIEAKQTAEQRALQAKRDLDRIKIEAEQKITRATAEAESQRMQKETISANILQLRAIEKWDGRFPQVIGGEIPFIDMNQLTPKK
ncbi:MAG TPA: prohibitin family protein [Nitrospiria bacterium]|jgi:regulator of protease activity HflC (stomatin/prohibitin superfamily)